MDTQTQLEPSPPEPSPPELELPPYSPAPHWSRASRLAFRFSALYLALYCLTTQITANLFVQSQGIEIPDPATFWPLRPLIFWTGIHIFHVPTTLAFEGNSGSGDDIFGYVLAFVLLILAALATSLWSVLDRRRKNYLSLQKWVQIFIRFCLAGQMFNYGMVKVIPTQMTYPSLVTLLLPFGELSPMGVLWTSIGSSPAYETFAGCVEVFAGLLLIFPRTTTLGALIALSAMTEVFILNMTYDVPVKLFAFHLILMALFLLAPDLPRLLNVVLHRTSTPSMPGPVRSSRSTSPRIIWIALAAQILFGIWLLGMNFHGTRQQWKSYSGGRPHSALYGIWDVSQMSIDQQLRPPLLTDSSRWRRAIFDSPARMTLQHMDDSFAGYGAAISIKDNTLALAKNGNQNWKAKFNFERPSQDQLILDGDMNGHKVHMLLQRMDQNKFPLVSGGFHWIQE